MLHCSLLVGCITRTDEQDEQNKKIEEEQSVPEYTFHRRSFHLGILNALFRLLDALFFCSDSSPFQS